MPERDLRALLVGTPARPVVVRDVAELVPLLDARVPVGAAPFERAVVSGFLADRLGFAFVGGYRAALAALVPELATASVVTFAATEAGGAHPRAIATRLARAADGSVSLAGEKHWATLAPVANLALVVASEGLADDGRPRLRLVKVSLDAPGVSIEPMAAPSFAPEVPHAKLGFASVRLSESDLLPGDGYERYLKPFRTIEDLHVHAAVTGYLVSLVRRSGEHRELVERLLALSACLETLSRQDPGDPGLHLALAGAIRETEALVSVAKSLLARALPEEAERFDRDLPLFGVAARARAARTERAWTRLGSGSAESRKL